MRPIKAALSSYGMSGLVFHGPLLERHHGFEIVSILERHRSDSVERHPGSRLVRTYQEILDDPEVELVVVNTPDHLHFEMVMEALKKKKHVVAEKPFTQTAGEADELIRLARTQGCLLSVFQNRRWDGDFLTVQKVIAGGSLGRLVSFESHFDRFRNYIQDSWKESDELKTGTLYNLGSHMIDQALVLFGMPEAIYADIRALRTGSKVDDSFDIIFHYPDVKCFVRGSYLVKEPGPRYILHGTRGSFVKWGIDPQEEALKKGGIPGSEGWGTEPESEWGILHFEDTEGTSTSRVSTETVPGDYLAYYNNIHDAIRKGAPLAVKPEEARDVIRIIEAAYESSRSLQTVRLKDN